MRKFGVIIGLCVSFFILYFLQVNIFSNYTIGGVSPNLFVIYILFIGLFANQSLGITFGVIIGLIIDFVYGKTIGITAVMLCIIGYLGSYFDKNFSKENKFTILIMAVGATIIFELGSYFLNSMILDFQREYWQFFKILMVEILYNVLLTIIFYPFIQKMGYVLDRVFKRNNILTRYF